MGPYGRRIRRDPRFCGIRRQDPQNRTAHAQKKRYFSRQSQNYIRWANWAQTCSSSQTASQPDHHQACKTATKPARQPPSLPDHPACQTPTKPAATAIKRPASTSFTKFHTMKRHHTGRHGQPNRSRDSDRSRDQRSRHDRSDRSRNNPDRSREEQPHRGVQATISFPITSSTTSRVAAERASQAAAERPSQTATETASQAAAERPSQTATETASQAAAERPSQTATETASQAEADTASQTFSLSVQEATQLPQAVMSSPESSPSHHQRAEEADSEELPGGDVQGGETHGGGAQIVSLAHTQIHNATPNTNIHHSAHHNCIHPNIFFFFSHSLQNPVPALE
ncbi:uncharacterized protein [Dendrobates tinctorius]|uniref:uncharacterized protein n=1 Tax=Dendrobates tinctorius TaxID=92724 RepID=UPI003CC9A36B